jgi:hypothetical protein
MDIVSGIAIRCSNHSYERLRRFSPLAKATLNGTCSWDSYA